MNNNTLFQTRLKWKRHTTELRYCYLYNDEKIILLRTNNFPDEPLFTLINELEITSFDDAPDYWEIPYLSSEDANLADTQGT